MENKAFKLQIKEMGAEGPGGFTGYLSTFGNVDLGDDVVEKGAFTKTLQENPAFALYWAHDWTEPKKLCGCFTGKEDAKGLLINAEFLPDQDSQNVRLKIKTLFEKRVRIGLSIGYDTIKFAIDRIADRTVRRLKELKLNEGSIAMFPMNTEAAITSVKSLDSIPNEPGEPTRDVSGEAEPGTPTPSGEPQKAEPEVNEADGLPLLDEALATAKAISNLMEAK